MMQSSICKKYKPYNDEAEFFKTKSRQKEPSEKPAGSGV
jgi:hypothetical protein